MSTDSLLGFCKSVLDGARDRRETIQAFLTEYLSGDALKHLSEGRLFIPEDAIRREVMRIEEIASTLKTLHCDPESVLVELAGKSHGIAYEGQIRLRIRELTLTEARQTLVVHVDEESRPVGANMLGKIASLIGKVIINNLTGFALKNCDLGPYTSYDDRSKLITVRLNEIPNVKQLLEPRIASWNESVPLRLVGIEKAAHVPKGMELRLIVSPTLKTLRKGIPPAAKAAKGLLSRFKKP